jgi:hypothetical protein
MMQHMVEYKGHMIYCDNCLYYLKENPFQKYVSFTDCKTEVDKIEATLNNNIVNLRGIINQKQING